MITCTMIITDVIHYWFPPLHNIIVITFWSTSTTPIQVVCDALDPFTYDRAIFISGQMGHLLLNACKYNPINTITIKWLILVPLEICQASYWCWISVCTSLTYLVICLCLSVISVPTVIDFCSKKSRALTSPSRSMALLDFTSLL